MFLLSRYKYFILFALLSIFFGCRKSISDSSTNLTAMDIKNIAYGNDAAQKMDIYLPESRTIAATNVIILIHGGGWTSGDKSDFDSTIPFIKQNLPNFAIFNINYRLANVNGGNLWPTQISDVNAAFAFVTNKQNDYQINTNKMAVLGASAGAHLALLQAYKNDNGKQIKAVVDMFGPSNMTDLYNNYSQLYSPAIIALFMSGTPAGNPSNYLSASPLFFVNAQSPPTIIFHGTIDNVVPIRESDSLDIRLKNVGVKQQYIKYTGEGHGWTGINLIDTYIKIIAFIKENVV